MTAVDSLTSASEEAVLAGRDLSFVYPNGHVAFEGIDITVRPRELIAVLGGSGCGKSTLLRVLARLEEPSRGRIEMLGVELRDPHPRTALIFQQPSLLPWLSVASNVGFGLDFIRQPRLSRATFTHRIRHALEAVELDGTDRLFPNQLSGGMAQRVALARALAREPLVLLADEPFSALDVLTRMHMQTLLRKLVHEWEAAAVLVTHDLDEAILVADRVLLLGSPAPGQASRFIAEWPIADSGDRLADSAGLRFEILSAMRDARGAPGSHYASRRPS